jgi:hypothetical protein
MKQILLFLIFYSCFLLSCKSKSGDSKTIDNTFTDYIKNNFPKEYIKDSSIFLIIPNHYCISCKKIVISLLEKTNKINNFYIISRSNNIIFDSTENVLLIDKAGKFEKLDLGVNSAAILFRCHNKIEYITEINYHSVPKIEYYLSQFANYR